MNKKIVASGDFEDVYEISNHYFIMSKKDRIGVVPYTISSTGVIDKIGVIKDLNIIDNKYNYSVLNDYVSTDDKNYLTSAADLLKSVTGVKITDASRWMYIGSFFYNLISDSPIRLYCVNMTDISLKTNSFVEKEKKNLKFEFIDIERAISSEDMLLLASYFRIFNLFYIQNIK